MLRRSFDTLEPIFIEKIIGEDGMGLLSDQTSWVKLLKTMPEAARSAGIAASLDKEWSSNHSSEASKWSDIKKKITAFVSKSKNMKSAQTLSNKQRDEIEMWQCVGRGEEGGGVIYGGSGSQEGL
jgi:hypothetical protein